MAGLLTRSALAGSREREALRLPARERQQRRHQCAQLVALEAVRVQTEHHVPRVDREALIVTQQLVVRVGDPSREVPGLTVVHGQAHLHLHHLAVPEADLHRVSGEDLDADHGVRGGRLCRLVDQVVDVSQTHEPNTTSDELSPHIRTVQPLAEIHDAVLDQDFRDAFLRH